MNQSYCFETILSCEEIIEIVSNQKITIFSHGGIVGKVYGYKFKLFYMSFYRNSLAPVFYGSITNGLDKTMIMGTFKIAPTIKIFLRIWRVFLILIFIVIMLNAIVTNDTSGLSFLILILFMLGCSVAIENIGIAVGKKNMDKILSFIENSLLATLQA